MTNIKEDKFIYLGLFLIVFLVLLTSSYCPLNFRRMHVDSSIYVTIAQGITRGYLPYMDLVDNKGPLAYLLTVPGLYLGGFTGIWITEIILMCVSVFFAYKTALFFGSRYIALLGTIFSFVALLPFFSVSAGTEEYSLPFLMVSLYIFTKYFFNRQEINFVELIVLGFCFTCAALIKQNMFPLWAGFCMVILAETIIKRRFILLGTYILGFCCGIVIAFVPVFLYLKSNGIMDAFIDQVIVGGAYRGLNVKGLKEIAKNFHIVIHRNFSFVPLVFGSFMILKRFKQNDFVFYSGYTLSCFLMVLLLSFTYGDGHYNMALIPFFIPALTCFIKLVYSAFNKIKVKNVFLVLFFCFVFSEGLMKYIDDLVELFNNDSGTQLINAGRMIDENTESGDTIISLGFNAYIYLFTERNPASKYFYQGSNLEYNHNAIQEFITDILTNKPPIIALFNAEDGIGQIMGNWHDQIFEMIENDYRLLSDENGFNLFILKNR